MIGDTLLLRVAAATAIAPTLRHLRLVAADGSKLPPAAAGAHVQLSLKAAARTHRNAYSLVSRPGARDAYEIIVQLADGAPPTELRANASLFRSRVDTVPGPDNRLAEQPGGTLLKTWGSPGGGPGEFTTPHDLAFGRQGEVIVCDRDRGFDAADPDRTQTVARTTAGILDGLWRASHFPTQAGTFGAGAFSEMLIAGGFSINKPYYNLDPVLRYRQLGKLRNRGLELSLTGQLAPGLTLVGGTMVLDPRISGEAVKAGLIGYRPVGQIRRRSAANLDWRLRSGKSPISFDLALESLSRRVGNAANTLYAPARTTVNLGARYRFKLAGGDWLLRPVLINAFNNYGWQVSTSGGFSYTTPRTLTLQLAADF